MKNKLILFILCITFSITCINAEIVETKIEAPSTLDYNVLKDFNAFAVISYNFLKSTSLKRKVDEMIIVQLEKLGKIVKVEVPDVTAFGKSGACLCMTINKVSTMHDIKMRALQTSLNLKTFTKITKTKNNCFTKIWSTDVFIEGEEEKNEEDILMSVSETLQQFSKDYKLANAGTETKPVFYLYK